MKSALIPLYSCTQLRAVEDAVLPMLPAGTLMRRAAQAAADLAQHLLASDARPDQMRRVLVLAGPGNNGGDALLVALLLAQAGVTVQVMDFGRDGIRPADAQNALQQCGASGALFAPAETATVTASNWDLVVDGLFGIGLRRGLEEPVRAIVQAVNNLACPVLALDVPSGLDADSGTLVGEDGCAIVATHTITFIGDKPGLHTLHGRDFAGQVTVADLGIEPAFLPATNLFLSGIHAFRSALRRRTHSSHKGTHGDVVVAGGAGGMTGAPILAARAAIYSGAGRVFVALLDRTIAFDGVCPELMLRTAADIQVESHVVVAGPGMARADESRALLERVLESSSPIVLDADALNMIASDPALESAVARREAGTVMTPHPLEAARLLKLSAKDIQARRIESGRELARRFNCVALLKGSGSVIARADGQAMINPTGNPALATAGTGDVLSGICGALLAQGFSPWQAALAAAWLHGAAADALVAGGVGPIGATASELIPHVRALLNRVTEDRAKRQPIRGVS